MYNKIEYFNRQPLDQPTDRPTTPTTTHHQPVHPYWLRAGRGPAHWVGPASEAHTGHQPLFSFKDLFFFFFWGVFLFLFRKVFKVLTYYVKKKKKKLSFKKNQPTFTCVINQNGSRGFTVYVYFIFMFLSSKKKKKRKKSAHPSF